MKNLTCLFPLSLAVLAASCSLAAAQPAGFAAKWTWLDRPETQPYNQTIIARKEFDLDRPARGTLRIAADSFYRLSVNGEWINDGPARCWPEHFQYDALDVSGYLRSGKNQIEVVARYFGVGDFHRVPKQPGLLVELDVAERGGQTAKVVSDGSWQVAEARAWRRATPKVSIQMEPVEVYEAQQESVMSCVHRARSDPQEFQEHDVRQQEQEHSLHRHKAVQDKRIP